MAGSPGMRLNADFSQRVLVRAADNPWVPSPMAGVERGMLDRIGDEVARATSIVRYAPGSRFSAHVHDGGEEFLVLEGTFCDEQGSYRAGSYVRNPPTSRHTPSAPDGATILVKLHQFDPADRTEVRIDTTQADPAPVPDRPGVRLLPLFRDAREEVRLECWDADADVTIDAPGGLEVFVVEGEFRDGEDSLRRWDWLRLPPGARLEAKAGGAGARVWLKTGHLRELV